MIHNTNNQQVRHQCRACHNICFTPDGGPPEPAEGYRCEACEAAGYERYDFDKSLPNPNGEYSTDSTKPLDPTPPMDPTEPTEVEQPAEEPKSTDEAKGEVVEVSSAAAEAQ
jgi:hypothetical protein